jgi:hypothetical protein
MRTKPDPSEAGPQPIRRNLTAAEASALFQRLAGKPDVVMTVGTPSWVLRCADSEMRATPGPKGPRLELVEGSSRSRDLVRLHAVVLAGDLGALSMFLDPMTPDVERVALETFEAYKRPPRTAPRGTPNREACFARLAAALGIVGSTMGADRNGHKKVAEYLRRARRRVSTPNV